MENANLEEGSTSLQKVKLKDALGLRSKDETAHENLVNRTVRMSPTLMAAIQAAADLHRIEFAIELRTTLELAYSVKPSSQRYVTVGDLDDAFKAHEQLYHTVKEIQPPLPDEVKPPAKVSKVGRPKKPKEPKNETSTATILEVLLENMRSRRIITPTQLGQDTSVNMKGKPISSRLIKIGIKTKNTRLHGNKPGRYFMLDTLPAVEAAYENEREKESSGMDNAGES